MGRARGPGRRRDVHQCCSRAAGQHWCGSRWVRMRPTVAIAAGRRGRQRSRPLRRNGGRNADRSRQCPDARGRAHRGGHSAPAAPERRRQATSRPPRRRPARGDEGVRSPCLRPDRARSTGTARRGGRKTDLRGSRSPTCRSAGGVPRVRAAAPTWAACCRTLICWMTSRGTAIPRAARLSPAIRPSSPRSNESMSKDTWVVLVELSEKGLIDMFFWAGRSDRATPEFSRS